MRICFPIERPIGLHSRVYEHFGSAPAFIIVDTDSRSLEEVKNNDLAHAHGMCQPLKALGGRNVDAVAVGGIGMGALMKLHAQGVRVFKAQQGTIAQNLEMLMEQKLPEFDASSVCAGHAGGGCAH